ncbi:hypothetical protein [Mediterraneibacter gnavus]|uniref:hypothetical protein n=1 Tax=Mediterraneibacter gnavus TaxID=33038 RepID=UPI0032B7BE8C
MLKMVDGSGIIGVDMVCPLGVSTPQPPNYDKVELEGAGMLVLPNSLDAPLERLELGGKAEQVQTSGAQLLNKDNFFVNPPTTFDKLKYYPLNIGDKECTLSTTCPAIGNTSNLFLLAGNIDKGASSSVNGVSFGISRTVKSQDGYVTIALRTIGDNPNNPLDYDIMLNYGSEAKPYEPYTGGKPSPSPEYPQEIKNVGKWNEETQKYEIEISISGRNLFDFSTCEEGKIFEGSGSIVSAANGLLTDFIPCFPNSQYSRSRTGSTVVAFYDCDKNKIGFEIVGNTTFVTPEKCRYFRFSAVKTAVDYTKIVACPGQTVMDYEPYREPKFFTLTSDRPITKWDRLVEQGGQIGWLYGSVIATIDETADISLYAPNGFFIHVKNIDKKEKTGYCDKLYTKKMSNGEPFVLFGIANNNFLYTLNTQEFYGKTASEIKAKLKEYPLNIIGKSETTEFIPLQQSEQNAIRALKTYYPTTVITADGGELDPDIKVTYRKEI